MSYAQAGALQAAVWARLMADAGVQALAPGAVFDAAPPGTPAGPMVLIGPEEARDASDATGPGAEHDLRIEVTGGPGGFAEAKALAAAVSDALLAAAPPVLARGRCAGLWFLRARAERTDDGRRIALVFRARVEG